MRLLAARLLLILRLTALVVATGSLYWQDIFSIMREATSNELANYMLAVPFLAGFLVYVKRRTITAAIAYQGTRILRLPVNPDTLIGGLLIFGAVLLYWYGSYGFYPLEYHLLSLPLYLAGLILLLFNQETLRVLVLPLVFLSFLQPLPLEFALAAGADLAILSARLSHAILRGLGQPLDLVTVFGAPVFVGKTVSGEPLFFAVTVACSGVYSLVGFTSFAFFAGSVTRGRFLSRVTLFLLGFPIVYGLNILRIILVTGIGYWYGEEMATQAFHLIGGSVLIFLGVLLLLLLGEKLFKVHLLTRKTGDGIHCVHASIPTRGLESCRKCGTVLNRSRIGNLRSGLPKVGSLVLLAILLVNLQVPVFALTAGPAEISLDSLRGPQGTQMLLPFRPGWEARFIFRDSRFEKVSGQEASLLYAYSSRDLQGATVFSSVEIGTSRVSVHGWFESLVIWRQRFGRSTATVLEYKDVEIWQNPPVVGKFFAFHPIDSNITQVVLYWIESSQFKVGSSIETRLVKTSLIGFPEDLARAGLIKDPADLRSLEGLLLIFARDIIAYWSPAKTWSWAALALAKAGGVLATLSLSVAAAISTVAFVAGLKQKRANTRVYYRINNPDEKLLLQAVKLAGEPTNGSKIMEIYSRLTGKTIDEGKMQELVSYAEEAGLVGIVLSSKNDEPKVSLKCNFTPR